MSNNDNGQDKPIKDLRKDATGKTILINKEALKKIDWDKVKIEKHLAKKGLLDDAGLIVIEGNDPSTPVWDLSKYAFLLKDDIPSTVNPKLWEQGKLNLNAGLFKVTENIYQIRGFDIANMTFIKGEKGWIVIDCLTTRETANAALQFARSYFRKLPISALIITHSHVDHYGGVLAVMDYFIDDQVKIYAPENFVNSSRMIIENIVNLLIILRFQSKGILRMCKR